MCMSYVRVCVVCVLCVLCVCCVCCATGDQGGGAQQVWCGSLQPNQWADWQVCRETKDVCLQQGQCWHVHLWPSRTQENPGEVIRKWHYYARVANAEALQNICSDVKGNKGHILLSVSMISSVSSYYFVWVLYSTIARVLLLVLLCCLTSSTAHYSAVCRYTCALLLQSTAV